MLVPLLLLILHYLPLTPGARAWSATLGGMAFCLAALVHDNPWFTGSLFGALLVNVLSLALANDREVLMPLLVLLYQFVWL
ncbi:hypothetical protein [Pseudomonas putida]